MPGGADDPEPDAATEPESEPETEPSPSPEADADSDGDARPAPALVLPESLRGAFKDPMGPVFTDASTLLAEAGRPVVAVGDVVTYHLLRAGHEPAVAVVDGRTKRRAVTEEVATVLGDRAVDATGEASDSDDESTTREGEASAEGTRLDVRNAPGTVSRALVAALADAVGRPGPVVVRVDGEEDLATLPALLAAPPGAAVVYGQPDEGMVLVRVDEETRGRARDLLSRMDGDVDAVLAPLSASGERDGDEDLDGAGGGSADASTGASADTKSDAE